MTPVNDALWIKLGLTRARLSDWGKVDDEEIQPALGSLVFPNDPAIHNSRAPLNPEDAAAASVLGASDEPHRETLHRPGNWHGQEPVERIVKAILLCAIRDGASEINIEPQSRAVTVKYRIKGVLRDHLKLPMLVLEPIASRFKMLGRLDPAATAAQWGIIRLRVDERDYDLQISTQPTEQGERILLRLTSGLRR